jgi:hypothetical protein
VLIFLYIQSNLKYLKGFGNYIARMWGFSSPAWCYLVRHFWIWQFRWQLPISLEKRQNYGSTYTFTLATSMNIEVGNECTNVPIYQGPKVLHLRPRAWTCEYIRVQWFYISAACQYISVLIPLNLDKVKTCLIRWRQQYFIVSSESLLARSH